MGARGKAPMPQKLRLLNGDPNLSRYNNAEPVPIPGELTCPDDVSADVRRVWLDGVIELQAMQLAFPSDVNQWRAYCEAVVVHEKACAVLAASPILIRGVEGGLIKNPALQVQRDAALTLLRFAAHFGLTPSARSTVQAHLPSAQDSNPFADGGGW